MLNDIQTVFSFLAVLLDMVEKLYTECALFYIIISSIKIRHSLKSNSPSFSKSSR